MHHKQNLQTGNDSERQREVGRGRVLLCQIPVWQYQLVTKSADKPALRQSATELLLLIPSTINDINAVGWLQSLQVCGNAEKVLVNMGQATFTERYSSYL